MVCLAFRGVGTYLWDVRVQFTRRLPLGRNEKGTSSPSKGDRQNIRDHRSRVRAAQGPSEVGFKGPLIAVHERGESAAGLSGQPDSHRRAPSNFPYEASSPAISASVVRTKASRPPLLIATVPLTIGNQEYVVEAGAPKQPIKTVLHGALITLLVGLVVGLTFATWGSCFFIKRALVPVHKISLTAQALPVAHPDKRLKSVAVWDDIESLCTSVSEMIGQLEKSFQIGTVLPTEAFHAPSTRLATISEELAALREKTCSLMGIPKELVRLLKEIEQLSGIARDLSTPSHEDAWQTRTERFRFYLCDLAAIRAEHVCILTEKLGSDFTSGAQEPSYANRSVHW